ncbi:MAG: OmpA family protein [Saprospiraceae bacterium]|nr:OmpA family protein [Saprospiraceae bacterium]
MSFERKLGWLASALALPFFMAAQTKDAPINFANPSFEDLPRSGVTPSGWYDCGSPGETPPDVQPGQFDVTKPPSHGNSYLGLVVRDNETWEGVAQRLSRPLEKGQCYEFTMDICRSELYLSTSKLTGQSANYATPAKLRIWGGTGFCSKAELLYETSVVTNTRWLGHTFRLSPKNSNYSFIFFEAYYKTPVLFPYNGNILLDNASAIKPVVCGPDKMPDEKPPAPPITTNKPKENNTTSKGGATVREDSSTKRQPEPVKPVATDIERRKGKIYRLDHVYFDAGKFEIKPESEPELEKFYKFLRENPDIVVEVRGHTNNLMYPDSTAAFNLSTNRAKSVAEWLVEKGIDASRVQYKGYGWKMPVEPNTSPEGRKKNQRVEVKIVNMNG